MELMTFLKACRQDIWDAEIKLVRHTDEKWDLERLLRDGWFNDYQARQSADRFQCKYIVSFIGERGSLSRFIGVYEVRGTWNDAADTPYPPGFPHPEMGRGVYRYDLATLREFEGLHDRLVIDWGAATRSWHQWLTVKEVVELRPRGFVREFTGYEDVHLEFDELRKIIDHADANWRWHSMLAGVAGVYLIVDGTNGDQYVGSAYGEDGILGRWKMYVATKHGGNKRLVELLAQDPQRHIRFSFSILRTLPRSLTPKEVIAVEDQYKRKLGTRAFGLNEN
jgi:hypothetical protein